MEQLTKNQAVATSQEAVQNQNEPQLRDENAHNDKSVHGVLNPTYQAGLRRDAVQPDIEAERKKRDEIEAGKSYCSRRFGGATCDDKSARSEERFSRNAETDLVCRLLLEKKKGDPYERRRSLTINGWGSVAGALFGSAFPTTMCIGHLG